MLGPWFTSHRWCVIYFFEILKSNWAQCSWRSGGLMVSVLVPRLNGLHLSHGRWQCTAFLSKTLTVIPIKPWTPEKISGMFIVSRPIRSEMKPQKITAKPQHALVTPWFKTTSWVFLPRQIFNFTVFKYWNCFSFVFQLIYVQRRDMNDMFSDIFMGKRSWIE